MIAEIWSGRASAERLDAVTTELQAKIQAKIKSTSACRGAYVLRRQLDGGQYEILILTVYEPERGSRGSGAGQPDASALPDLGATVISYEVVTDPARTLLYAELSRRFPLRRAALR